jgi:predicted RNA-binding protein with RPS1 domain
MTKIESFEKGIAVEGKITNITTFGVFVNLGGVTGLLHRTQIFSNTTDDWAKSFRIGQAIAVKILNIKDRKVSLGEYFKMLCAEKLYGKQQQSSKSINTANQVNSNVELENKIEQPRNVREIKGINNQIRKNYE